MKRYVLAILGGLFLLLVISTIGSINTIDRTSYKDMQYFQQSVDYMDSLALQGQSSRSVSQSFRVGWAKVSLLPSKSTPLAGYGDREGALSEGVRDSLWVRAFVLDNGTEKYAMLSADLLIIPLQVTKRLEESLGSIGFSLDRTFMSATHTHSSVGAWDPSTVGEMFAGPFDESMVDFIEAGILKAIEEAGQNLLETQVGYTELSAPDFVYNRLVRDEGIEDPYFRMLKFVREDSSSAVWMTYAAHATCFSGKQRQFSQDYPGRLVELFEQNSEVDFAVYAAGAVGSHGPDGGKLGDDGQIEFIAQGLYEKVSPILADIPLSSPTQVSMVRSRIFLREPHLRLSSSVRLRPWIFNQLLGDFPAFLTGLRIGETILIGTPCDFSGELVPELEKQDVNLMVTSFNGGYVGYITKDKWYELDTYETRVMNWFGPYNGSYFVEMMNRLIEVMDK